MNTSEAFARVNALTQEQRDEAYAAARLRIVGERPTVEQFAGVRWAKYPARTLAAINVVGGFMLIAAFVPSAIRLYQAGVQATAAYMPDDAVAQGVIGFMSVILAETGQIALTLWASTINDSMRGLRRALYIGAGLCTAFAYVGNYSIVANNDGHGNPVLLAFEIFLPPTLVLIAANVLKAQVLDGVEARHLIHTRYSEAVSAWDVAYQQADHHALWDRTLANTLRDALRAANRSSKAVLRELTREDWIALVMRERTAEEWWTDTQTGASGRPRPAARRLTDGQTADTRTASEVTDQTDGQWTPERVAEHLRAEPDDAGLSIRALATKLGATKYAVEQGKRLLN